MAIILFQEREKEILILRLLEWASDTTLTIVQWLSDYAYSALFLLNPPWNQAMRHFAGIIPSVATS